MSNLEVPNRSGSANSSREKPVRTQRSRANSEKKDEVRDAWQENIHFIKSSEDPETAARIAKNQKLVGEHD